MKAAILQAMPEREFLIPEGCYVLELSNTALDAELSIAKARVAPGVTTQWHCLIETSERYVILSGEGCVEIGDLPPQAVEPGDVVLIPPGCRQRIANTGGEELIFLALCTPRFRGEAYKNLE